eukprot:scaffold4459_cov57-Isochrysis_galbana.AAC.1
MTTLTWRWGAGIGVCVREDPPGLPPPLSRPIPVWQNPVRAGKPPFLWRGHWREKERTMPPLHYDPSGDIEINADAAGLFGASIAERLSEVRGPPLLWPASQFASANADDSPLSFLLRNSLVSPTFSVPASLPMPP